MRKSWNTGLTKESNTSVKKTSETMRARKLDNFKNWRDRMKSEGVIKSSYKPFARSKYLAELIGVVLGDGHISLFPRTECLRIVANSDNQGFIDRYTRIVTNIFGKKPHVARRKNAHAVNITIYEKSISQRLDIPTGARSKTRLPIPSWIHKNRGFALAYLRGLYEAEGSYSTHEKTGTYKFVFSNTNASLLHNVKMLLETLGFHPSVSSTRVQVSRRQEVQKLKNLLEFRRY